MSVNISIIIPTYTNTEGLKKCVESVIEYTSFENFAELIIVSNGSDSESVEYIKSLRGKIPEEYYSYSISPDPLGFPKAINTGVEKAKEESEYFVFLNDDTILLPQKKNEWLKILRDPFLFSGEKIATTGPLSKQCPHSLRNFILFFCVMTNRESWSKFGPLNEDFSPGGCEDILYCIKAEDAGYKNVLAPYEAPQPHFDEQSKFFVSRFPIYHVGGETVSKIPNFNQHFDIISQQLGRDHRKKEEAPIPEPVQVEPQLKEEPSPPRPKLTVTATISTKDRFFDTLPVTISSIISQTVKPDEFILFEDGEKLDIREVPIYRNMLHVFDREGIKWHVVFGEGKGQVKNHQKAVDIAKTDLIWRLDDDVQPEPKTLETLLSHFEDEKVGAVGSLVVVPDHIIKANSPVGGSTLKGCLRKEPNDQWFIYPEGTEPFEVEHLHCSFIFRVSAAKHGYNMDLSPVGHTEETLFTYEMFREGWKLIVDPSIITWHYRNPSGGIRAYDNHSLWEADERVFRRRIAALDKSPVSEEKNYNKKFVYLDNGKGDHVEFLRIVPEMLEKYDKIIIACCFPDVFEEYKDNPKIEIASLAEVGPFIGNVKRYQIYEFMSKRNWSKPIVEAFREMYL